MTHRLIKLLLVWAVITAPVSLVFADSETDREITRQIQRNIFNEKITVVCHDGVVRLTGTVPTKSEKMALKDKASAIDGVKRVQNKVKVQR